MTKNRTKLLFYSAILASLIFWTGPASSNTDCEAEFLTKQARQAKQVQDLRGGNLDPLPSLMKEYNGLLRRAWRSDYPDMEFSDFQQEVSLAVIEDVKNGTFCRSDRSFAKWLKDIVYGTRVDIVRRNAGKDGAEKGYLDKFFLDFSEGPEDRIVDERTLAARMAWLENEILPSLSREVRRVAIAYLKNPGGKYKQLGEELGVSESAFGKSMWKIRKCVTRGLRDRPDL